MDNL
jgi:serine/threonine protein kinase